jgi:hypothetical protein
LSNAPSMPGRMPHECPSAMHATYATQLTLRIQDPGENPRVPDAAGPVESRGSAYVESSADHAFSAFLAALTPSKVLRDRELTFSKSERKRMTFLRQKAHTEALARQAQTKDAA